MGVPFTTRGEAGRTGGSVTFTTTPDHDPTWVVDGVRFTTDVTSDAHTQLLPGSAGEFVQRVAWEVLVDGVEITDLVLPVPLSVSRSINRPLQVGSFSVLPEDGRGFNNPADGFLSLDTREILMRLRYRTSSGETFREALITDGIQDSGERSHDPYPVEAISLLDAGGRYRNARVSYQLAAGSGKARTQLVRELALAAGVPAATIRLPTIGGAVYKAVDLAKGDWLDLAQTHAEVPGARLLWNRGGELTAVFDAPESDDGRAEWTFGPEDWVQAVNGTRVPGPRVRPAPQPPTSVTVRGSRQVVRADAGMRSRSFQERELSEVRLDALAFFQEAGGSPSYVASGSTDVLVLRLTMQSRTDITTRGGTPILTMTEASRWRNLQAARFTRDDDAAAAITAYHGAYVEAASEGSPGWVYPTSRLMRDERVVEQVRIDPSTGEVLQRLRHRYGWYNPRVAIKTRSAVTAGWDTVGNGGGPYLDLGDRTGVLYGREQWLLLEQELETYEGDNGYQRRRTLRRDRYARRPGVTHLYADGEFGVATEVFLAGAEQEVETWHSIDEDRTWRTLSTYSAEAGKWTNEYELQDSGPPSREKAEIGTDRFEHVDMEHTCSVDLGPLALDRELPAAYFEAAETPDELGALCDRILLKGRAAEVAWTVLPNPRVEEGQRAWLVGAPGQRLRHRVHLRDVTTNGPPDGPILTVLSGVIYPQRAA